MICQRLNDGKDDEYLVDGAVLSCTSAKWGEFKLSDGSSVQLDVARGKRKEGVPTVFLRVRENPLTESESGSYHYATVADAVKFQNITPFLCNCCEPANSEQEQKIKENMDECRKHGVCQYLMDLEEEWENIDFGVEYESFFNLGIETKFGCTSYIEGQKVTSEEESKAGIIKTSVLFCKHGGFIYPVDSGQNNNEQKREWAMGILEQYLKGEEEDEEQAQRALETLASLSSYELPLYGSKGGFNYNQYDTYILGWVEYYNANAQYKIDPVYMKAQCYRESRVGEGTTGENVPTTNPHRDIMQALDVKNYNIYSYVGIPLSRFRAEVSEERKKRGEAKPDGCWEGTQIWDKNHADNEEKPGDCDPDRMQRCGGLISTLFTQNQDGSGECFCYENKETDEKIYYFQHEKVTPIMSLGVGIDTMTEEMQKNEGDIRQSLMNYNKGDSKEEYADFIINVANKTEPITLE